MKILLVDDEPGIRELLGEYLAAIGHRVEVFENGLLAWNWLEAAGFACDLVIADIKMPVMDGPELLRRLQAQGGGIPVLLISGHVNASADDAMLAGAVGIVHKPFRLADILEVVRRIESELEEDA